jgi:serine/threonine protein kinase
LDGISPIEAFLSGRLREEDLLAEVDRVIVGGSESDRTALVGDWRTKSGRIRNRETRLKLDDRVRPIAWALSGVPEANRSQSTASVRRGLQPGDVLANRFIIESKIGAGGMSTVFKARDLRRVEAQDRNPYVAVKTLNVESLEREDSLKILQREARKAQNLSHPNIVRVYDFDRDGDIVFITMELLEGVSLEQVIRENGILGAKLASLLPILDQIVSALDFAHSEGIVHSDLKPANIIILPNGRVKVIDFGIARAIPNTTANTSDRTTFDVHALGAMTPAYASPEMIEGQDPDPRDDVFALSCIVYEFLTGRHPFGRAPASMARAGNFTPQEPTNLLPRQWRALLAGLHLERSKRTAYPRALSSSLSAEALGFSERFRKFAKSAAIPGMLVVAILIGVTVIFNNGRDILRPDTEENTQRLAQTRAAEEAAQKAAQQKAADEAAQKAAQQKAAEEAAQKAAQQKAADEAAQKAAQQKAADEAAQKAAQQKAAEEAAQKAAQRKATEEAAQKAAQQKAADEAAQNAAKRKPAEEAAQNAAKWKAAEEAAQKVVEEAARKPIIPAELTYTSRDVRFLYRHAKPDGHCVAGTRVPNPALYCVLSMNECLGLGDAPIRQNSSGNWTCNPPAPTTAHH